MNFTGMGRWGSNEDLVILQNIMLPQQAPTGPGSRNDFFENMTSDNGVLCENGRRDSKSEFSILKTIDVACEALKETFEVVHDFSARWH